MKKILFILFIAFFSQNISAQLFTIGDVGIGYLYLGPKAGVHGSWVSNTTTAGSDSKTLLGYQFGVVGKFGITEKLAIQPELIFTRKGAKETFNGGEAKSLASYIGIPILAKISVIKIGNIMLHGSGGIYTNITTSMKSIYEFDQFSEETKLSSNHYKTVDFGISFGGGATYDLGHGLLVGEITIEHGFVDMYEDDYLAESNRNTTVGLNVSYLFDFAELSANLLKK